MISSLLPSRPLVRLALLLLALAAPAGRAVAGEHESSRLEANRKRWESLGEEERNRIREFARTVTPERLRQLRSRLEWLKTRPEAERRRITSNRRRFAGLTEEKKAAASRALRRFHRLSRERQAEIRKRVRGKAAASSPKSIPPLREIRKERRRRHGSDESVGETPTRPRRPGTRRPSPDGGGAEGRKRVPKVPRRRPGASGETREPGRRAPPRREVDRDAEKRKREAEARRRIAEKAGRARDAERARRAREAAEKKVRELKKRRANGRNAGRKRSR